MKKYTTDLETMASGKEIYDRIQIPEELADVVSRSIRSVDKRKLLKPLQETVNSISQIFSFP